MLNLTATTDKIQLTTGTAADVDVHASWVDLSGTTVTPGRTNTAITSAATTDIVASPGASTTRNIKTLHIYNKDATDTTDVTVIFDQNGTDFSLWKVSLAPGESLEYVEGIGFFEIAASTAAATSVDIASANTAQIASHSADTYYIGINTDDSVGSRLQAGCFFRWEIFVTKGAAGTATPTFNIRFGTAGTTADTSRCLMTMSAQTAAADSGHIRVVGVFRSVGGGTSAVIQGATYLEHQLATTGLNSTTTGSQLVQTTGGGFDSTVAGSKVGLSVNPGTSGAWVVELVTVEAQNLKR